jgi:tripeptidyl-peptidase-1
VAAGGSCFTDVTSGTNAIDRSGAPLKAGWNVTKGWDPVTGLGTPMFPNLLAAAMAPTLWMRD